MGFNHVHAPSSIVYTRGILEVCLPDILNNMLLCLGASNKVPLFSSNFGLLCIKSPSLRAYLWRLDFSYSYCHFLDIPAKNTCTGCREVKFFTICRFLCSDLDLGNEIGWWLMLPQPLPGSLWIQSFLPTQ